MSAPQSVTAIRHREGAGYRSKQRTRSAFTPAPRNTTANHSPSTLPPLFGVASSRTRVSEVKPEEEVVGPGTGTNQETGSLTGHDPVAAVETVCR